MNEFRPSAGTYGVVAAVGPGVSHRAAEIGDRVMVHHHWGCGTCRHCRAGWTQMCDGQTAIIYGISAHDREVAVFVDRREAAM